MLQLLLRERPFDFYGWGGGGGGGEEEGLEDVLGLYIFFTRDAALSFLLYNVINQVISYWPSYRSEVCCIGPRRSRGPIQLAEDL